MTFDNSQELLWTGNDYVGPKELPDMRVYRLVLTSG